MTYRQEKIDVRSLNHPVTQLAAEYGWRLDREYGGPGRCLYVGPGDQQIQACLTFDGEPQAGEIAVYYAFPRPPDAQWINVNYLSLADQMTWLRGYFADHANVGGTPSLS